MTNTTNMANAVEVMWWYPELTSDENGRLVNHTAMIPDIGKVMVKYNKHRMQLFMFGCIVTLRRMSSAEGMSIELWFAVCGNWKMSEFTGACTMCGIDSMRYDQVMLCRECHQYLRLLYAPAKMIPAFKYPFISHIVYYDLIDVVRMQYGERMDSDLAYRYSVICWYCRRALLASELCSDVIRNIVMYVLSGVCLI